jgi:hypothetical protein
MGVDQPDCSPAKWSNTNTGKQKKCRSPGCGLQFGGAENDLLAIRLRSSIIKHTFQRRPYEQLEVLSALVKNIF